MESLEGKVALVTGGARGIGRGIAIALAQAGVDIAIADVEQLSSTMQQYGTAAVGGLTDARSTSSEIVALGRRAIALQADVTKKEDTRRMVEETIEQLGHLHILVCNAGVITLSLVEALSEEAWDLTFAVNAKGVFLSCQAAIPVMKAQNGGCIINIASIAGKMGFQNKLITAPRNSPWWVSPMPWQRNWLLPTFGSMRFVLGSSVRKCLNIYLRDIERARSQKSKPGNESKRFPLSAVPKPLRTLAN